MTNIDEILLGDRTAIGTVKLPRLDPPTRTSQDEIAERVGHLRTQARAVGADVAELHDRALERQLEANTDHAVKRSVSTLLDQVAGRGFAWRDIAALVGVSVPAIRKWRLGGDVTGANRRAVAALVAFAELLQDDHLVQDVASWMEVPVGRSRITPIDLYAAGHAKLLLQYAAEHIDAEGLLDRTMPSWRDSPENGFEVTIGSDGEPIIRVKVPDQR